MAKNEIVKKQKSTPAMYSEKQSGSKTTANVTDIHRETYEPLRTTFEDIHSVTKVTETVSSKRR